MLSELKTAKKVVGAKQVRRALVDGRVKILFLAADADPRITQPLSELADQHSVPVEMIPTMNELGEACAIAVGSAVAAVLRA